MLVDKKKLGFKAIAVVAGMDIKGDVVAITMRDKSICSPDFIKFLNELRQHFKRKKTYIFLDNLSFHHSHIVAKCAARNR